MTVPCLNLQRIQRSFPTREEPRKVLNGIDLEIHTGDRIILFGPSGCGKTTLLHLMAFLDQPSGGQLDFKGEKTDQWSETRRCKIRAQEIGMVFQQFHLLPHHSVWDNLNLRLRYLPQTDPLQDHAERLLEKVGLADRKKQSARLLSGGEKQRLCIARAMLLQPSLFLADEPTGNLDEANADKVRELFMGVSTRGAAMVIATHDKRWFEFATRVYRFNQGQLEQIAL
ncbi:ABC transporter ATP-binding protein [Kiritimatiellaeota bacterium B1221]|nr:ABC transporter ATP-binding protein [Kiritimatiellaeota bacterium B1221]